MDKYKLSSLLLASPPVDKILFIQEACQDKDVLDLGCIRHNAEFATKDPGWIHQKIKDVAKTVIGIDYLDDEVEKLKKLGYNIRFGDVTKPLPLTVQFDVIVIGDLIVHLSNLDALFENCKKHLNNDGIIVITTPNPFYVDEFLYLAWKRNYLMNPEIVCWIDPYAMAQLAERRGFEITEFHFIKDSWDLPNMLLESEQYQYDILNDQWKNETQYLEVKRHIMKRLFNLIFSPFKFIFKLNSELIKYSDYLVVIKPTKRQK